jgi:P pilus assembly chaperone PapD
VTFARFLLPCALFLSAPAAGQMVMPMVYDLAPGGKQATRVLEFRNMQAKSLAIEMEATRRSYDDLGKAIDGDAHGAIEILPAQFVVAPGAMQKVQVRHKGPQTLTTSTSYAVSFREVALKQATTAPHVRTLIDVRTLAHVVPDGSAPDIRIHSVEYALGAVLINFVNVGTRYGRLDGVPLRLSSGGQSIDLSPSDLRDRLDLRWIDPGGQRKAVISLPLATNGAITAEWLRGD